mmetsp:Transcript_140080/g.446983  ORF Transcript_140080/g.446983 Transcript_140080/m.446983 type:complete len:333 (-) Transcript_140080:71-1069(-)
MVVAAAIVSGVAPEAALVGSAAASTVESLTLRRVAMVPAFLLHWAYSQAESVVWLVALLIGCSSRHGVFGQHLCSLLKTRFAHAACSRPVLDDTKGAVVYLCNHRSWGDFWIDEAILGGTSFVSRLAVAPAIPFTALWGYVQGWLWFFNRNGKPKDGWLQWMTEFLRRHHSMFPSKGLVFYPEGTRSQTPFGNPIKHTGLKAIYNLGWPVQVVITTNKERFVNERKCCVGIGEQLVSSVSDAIWPQQCTSADAFVEAFEIAWTSTWTAAYSAVACKGLVHRSRALLPGAVQGDGRRGSRVVKARVFTVLLIILTVCWRRWSAARSAARDKTR